MEDHRIYLQPVEIGEHRPLWSVLIPTYNCAKYLRETLISVLSQDPGPENMEIIVIDDHSTEDDPEEIVRSIAKDRVRFIRQERNVGKVLNYETGLKASRGILIHQLHGDDMVLRGFYDKMSEAFEANQEVSAIFCRSIYIDESGVWKNLTGIEKYEGGILDDAFERLLSNQIIQSPSMVVRRKVYEEIGTFDRRFDCLEDWEMWLRIAYRYKIAFINEVLTKYRQHQTNTTSRTILDGSLIETHRILNQIILDKYSSRLTSALKKKRNYAQAWFFLQSARDEHIPKDIYRRMILYALRYSKHPRILYNAFRRRK